jgi:transketolase
MADNIDTKCINQIRAFCADVVQKADSGHPGAPMGMAPMAHALWTKVMNFNPSNPLWINRDRFVLSNGHACALLYTMLHLSGYPDFTLEELKRFRQIDSKTPGHPENHFPGIEVTTGPLGQGISNAVGLAIAQEHLAKTFNKPGFDVIDNYVYVFVGDGCLQEGIASEAASLAGHLGLGHLIVLYDDNQVTIDGSTSLSFTENVLQRFDSYGWHTAYVSDGDNDFNSILKAIDQAKNVKDKPSLIKVRTTIGWGSKNQGTAKVHGSPLGAEDIVQFKTKVNLNPKEFFYLSSELKAVYNSLKIKGPQLEEKWNSLFQSYAKAHPELATDLKRRFDRHLPNGWQDVLPRFKHSDKALATRQLSHEVLKKVSVIMPELIGGSADLAPSNLTLLPNTKDFQKDSKEGRNIRYGVREHGMAAISNGIAAYGALIPFNATFLNFIGYAMGAVILSALSHLRVIYIMTHDSIGLGEDGPTHQPVDKFMACRLVPNLLFIRPADGNEVSAAYYAAISNEKRPSVLALSRQGLPQLEGSSIEKALKGAYVLSDSSSQKPDVILVGTGSEVSICVDAAKTLDKDKKVSVRVVSMPCWELFEEQSKQYKDSVFLPSVPVVSIEAGVTLGWSKYATLSLGIDRFGISAPAKDVYERLGLTSSNLAEQALTILHGRARL